MLWTTAISNARRTAARFPHGAGIGKGGAGFFFNGGLRMQGMRE